MPTPKADGERLAKRSLATHVTHKAAAPKSKRDATRTRHAILAAAMAEFSTKGVAGARIDRIAAAYHGSKNMIYHYFKSKEGLFSAVLEQTYATIRARQSTLDVTSQDPLRGIASLVEFTIDVFNDHPAFVALLHSENMAHAQHIKGSRRIVAMYNPLLATINDLLARGASRGLFRNDVSAIDLYICISAMASYPISNHYTLSALLGVDIGKSVRRVARKQQVVEMVLSYLTNTTDKFTIGRDTERRRSALSSSHKRVRRPSA
jgi:TetR/AcrR family transcriptional regulator